MVNVVIPSIVVVDHPGAELTELRIKLGEDGGIEVALIVICFELVVWPGALSVSVAVYVPAGNVTGKGVSLLSFVIEGVPVPVNCQLTFVEELIPLPVETKENNTVEPAHTSKVFVEVLN
jgi:hypothetical protein